MTTVSKKYRIKAPLNIVFQALTDKDQMEKWSGDEALMDLNKNGEFSLWSGSIHGVNKSVSAHQIIQDWKENSWKEYSTVKFNLSEENGQTLLELVHTDIPESSSKSIDSGWDEYYLGPLKAYVES